MSKEKFGVGQSIKYAKRKPRKALVFLLVVTLIAFLINMALLPYLEKYVSKRKSREIDKLKYEYALMSLRMERMNKDLQNLANQDDSLYASVFGLTPLTEEQRMAGVGGHDMNKNLSGYEYSHLMKSTNTKLKALEGKIQVQEESFKRIQKKAQDVAHKIANIPAIQPLKNKHNVQLSSGFGMRLHPVHDTYRMHTGQDFTAPKGTPIHATGDGTIVFAGNDHNGYGKYVIIKHGYGYQTLYGHMSRIDVQKGDKVKRGDVIGGVGSTGTSTAMHVHYEVIKKGSKVDPANFFFDDITYTEYREMMEISRRINRALD
jgi:murein DD-endopeptidase MepM/ murein hydrolase activator NlpD